jgi:hypothetical protein
MLTIDWAMRAICMASRTRQREGTPRSARYEGWVVAGSVMAHVKMLGWCSERATNGRGAGNCRDRIRADRPA